MAAIDQLNKLMEQATPHEDLKAWVLGKIPNHYKRLSCTREEALRLAKIGQAQVGAYFGRKLFFTQSLIAGAVLSGDYDDVIITTCSQYGKSMLMGMLGIIRAYQGEKQYIVATTEKGTKPIMDNVVSALLEVDKTVQEALIGSGKEARTKIDKLASAASRTEISFAGRGKIEIASLGETFTGQGRNDIVGRGGSYFVDEAANVSDDTYSEMGRGELNKVNINADGTIGKVEKSLFVAISNPHKTGWFWDEMVAEEIPERKLIVWMDALTAYEEQRWTKEQIFESKYIKNPRTLKTYWLCELDTLGESMLQAPEVYEHELETDEFTQWFMGIDSATKGKDNIEVSLIAQCSDGKVYIDKIIPIEKPEEWDDIETPKQIIRKIKILAISYGVSLICIDEAAGFWIKHGLQDEGLPVKGINFGSRPTRERQAKGIEHQSAIMASNLRAEMHLDLQMLLEQRAVMFSRQAYDKVKDIFPFITEEYTANGKIKIRPKPEIKALLGRSPDELDSAILAIHALILFGSEYNEFIL